MDLFKFPQLDVIADHAQYYGTLVLFLSSGTEKRTMSRRLVRLALHVAFPVKSPVARLEVVCLAPAASPLWPAWPRFLTSRRVTD